jgi:NADPH2:quinone reductase
MSKSATGGPVPPVDLAKYSRRGNISILLSALANSLDTREALEVSAARVQDLIVQGKLKVHKHKTYELQDAAQAHDDLEGRLTTGKLFLAI